MEQNQSHDSLIDMALKSIDFGEAINNHESFSRNDNPPKDGVLIIKRILGTKRNNCQCDHPFPYSDGIHSLEKKELQKWQIDRGEKMLEYLSKELEQIDKIAKANSISVSAASNFDQRRQFYYLTLLSILNSPEEIGMSKLNTLISFKKLLINRHLSEKNLEMQMPEQSCSVQGCPMIAIHGSNFCAWHILMDPNQQLFTPCEICGWPHLNLKNAQCNGHGDFV